MRSIVNVTTCAILLCCLTGLSLQAAPTNAIATSTFEVSDVTFTGGQIQFKVTNHSNPVLAYLVSVAWHLPDGHTRVHTFAKDHIFTLALAGKIIAAPGETHIGPLKTGESEMWNFGGPASQGTTITVEPLAVVYTDNSVIGDEKLAISEIFVPRQEFVNVMSQHLASLQQLTSLSSNDVLSHLQGLKSQYDERMSAATPQALVTRAGDNIQAKSDYEIYGKLSYDLDHLTKSISSGRASPELALSKYITEVTDEISVYKDHSNPA